MQLGVRLISNGQCPVHKYWEHLLDLVRKGDINPYDILTHRIRLDDMEKVYDLFSRRQDGMQKIFVQTNHSAPPAHGAPRLTDL